MRHIEDLNEQTIKNALKEGLITAKEAREMLVVYIQKSKLHLIQSTTAPTHTISSPHRP